MFSPEQVNTIIKYNKSLLHLRIDEELGHIYPNYIMRFPSFHIEKTKAEHWALYKDGELIAEGLLHEVFQTYLGTSIKMSEIEMVD
jgi:hypothetical protein